MASKLTAVILTATFTVVSNQSTNAPVPPPLDPHVRLEWVYKQMEERKLAIRKGKDDGRFQVACDRTYPMC